MYHNSLKLPIIVFALSLVLTAPVSAQDRCAGRQDCVYFYLILKCGSGTPPPPIQSDIWGYLWDVTDDLILPGYLLQPTSHGPYDTIYTAVALGSAINPVHSYRGNFLYGGSYTAEWGMPFHPPGVVSQAFAIGCPTSVFLPIVRKISR